MQNNVTDLTQRLLRALDSNYNVRNVVVFMGNSVLDVSGVFHDQVDRLYCSGSMNVNKMFGVVNRCEFRNICYSGCHMIVIKFLVLCHDRNTYYIFEITVQW